MPKILLSIIALLVSAVALTDENIGTIEATKIHQANCLIVDRMKDEKSIDFDFIKATVDPFIDESLTRGKVWFDPSKPTEKIFPFLMSPVISNTNGDTMENPYFEYALMKLINSQRFKTDKELRQQTCCELLRMFLPSKYTGEVYSYRAKYRFIFKVLLCKSPDFNNEAISVIRETIYGGVPFPQYLFLLGIANLTSNMDIKEYLISQAKKCQDFDRGNLMPWISLVLLANDGDKLAISKVIEIISKTSKDETGVKKAVYMFPYFAMVSQPEIVAQMKNFLSDSLIVDQGDDIMARYVGTSLFAAEVLYMIVDGFPSVSIDNYSDMERRKCIDWLAKNPNPKLKNANFWAEDPISSRMRYLLWGD